MLFQETFDLGELLDPLFEHRVWNYTEVMIEFYDTYFNIGFKILIGRSSMFRMRGNLRL